MGLGDFLLAAGQAKLMHQRTGKKIAIGNGSEIQQHDLYGYVPYLCNPRKEKVGFEWLLDWVGHRDYIASKERESDGKKTSVFNYQYKAEPAILNIDPIPNNYIIIEPRVKPGASTLKQWHSYQKVVDAVDADFLQFNLPTLKGVAAEKTDIVQAARWMAGCRFYVGTEGFLHHLAAAFGKPAVVLFGSYVPPSVLGYDFHTNIYRDIPDELGKMGARGFSKAMADITADEVIAAVRHYCRERPLSFGFSGKRNNRHQKAAGAQ